MPLNVDKISTGSLSVNGTEINKNGGLPYKIYTALLTQSGGDDPQTISFGSVVQGVSYDVRPGPISPGPAYDFSNVGGPVFPENWSFVATSSSEPISWNGAILDYNTGAPVVTVLENTIGNIWFNYGDVGQYLALSDGAFPLDKTGCFIGGTGAQSNCPSFVANTVPFGPNVGSGVYIQCSGVEFTPDYYTDDALANTMLEIRVYN